MRTATPATWAPARRMSSSEASAVPPVARTSSMTMTRSPASRSSAWISISALPYSSS
ncbi:hypothetical protein SGRI78S_00191 [Streptomyces griseus subsp. griseus]